MPSDTEENRQTNKFSMSRDYEENLDREREEARGKLIERRNLMKFFKFFSIILNILRVFDV